MRVCRRGGGGGIVATAVADDDGGDTGREFDEPGHERVVWENCNA